MLSKNRIGPSPRSATDRRRPSRPNDLIDRNSPAGQNKGHDKGHDEDKIDSPGKVLFATAVSPDAPASLDVTAAYHSIIPRKKSGIDHRTFYTLKIEAGFVIALLVLIGLVRAPMYPDVAEVPLLLAEQQIIQMEEILQTKQELPPPPPPRPPVPIEVANDVILENDDLNLDATLDIDQPIAALPPPPPPPVDDTPAEPEEPEVFVVVEEMPQLIGGTAAVARLVEYPAMARQAGVEGLVVVQFVVDENGNPINPFIAKGIGAGCDEEALRVVMLMKFVPGKQRGKAVRVQYSIPVRFRLQDRQG